MWHGLVMVRMPRCVVCSGCWERSSAIALAVLLQVGLKPEPALACPGFCDRGLEAACGRLFAAASRQQAATAAIGVVRAYDDLAARQPEYRAENYRIDSSDDLERWCQWATGRSSPDRSP